ncbi:MAG TPA: bifunctional 3-(3-hydroxy-phenyl)propionate/3-hydroxycinnamic acid hydroxylase [Kineosporiaceae bacterium]|nr:bifunctional 3-(3-hydroxy-phenyl)propionate/3-hydroxycinnamic acid hydroxylase [Kineosporiaceae bacterium]
MTEHFTAPVTPATTERVVVVGAGPAGCTSALFLADRGVPVTLLERYVAPHPLPRAVHLDDEVTRILHRLGLSEQFLARSRPASGLRLLDGRHQVMAEFRREQTIGRHGFPQANMFDQPELEELLLSRVEQHPLIDLRRGLDVVGIEGFDDPFTAEPVRVVARPVDGRAEQTFTGRVVLGADGANSTVRDLVGVTMQDLGFTERWLVVDVRADRDLNTWDGVEQVCDPARAATFMQVIGNRYRWEFQLQDGEDEADLIAPGALGQLLQPWTGRSDLDGLEIVRSATYTFRARIASSFRVGRVFLLGDAAHLTPPFIGQGLGAGLRDANNLAWKVADVLTGRADPSLLDSYDAERRPHATALVKRAVTIGWAMTGGQDWAAAFRRVFLAAACRSTKFRAAVASPSTPPLKTGALQQTGRFTRQPRGLRVGGLIGNALVTTDGSGSARLDDVLGQRTAVLTARRPEPGLVDLSRRNGFLLVRVVPAGRRDTVGDGWVQAEVADPEASGLAGLLADPALAVVVRPDRVVAAVARRPHLPALPWSARTVPAPTPSQNAL